MNPSKPTQNKIELHGWNDLLIPTETLFSLSSRAYKLYGYLVFRARCEGSCYPGRKRMVDDLSTANDAWSLSTVKRALVELTDEYWIVRNRRFGKSATTHVFKTQRMCQEYIAEWFTSEPSNGSPVSHHKEYTDKDHTDTTTGADAPKEPGEKKQRPPNPLFDELAVKWFGIKNPSLVGDQGGRIGKVLKAVKKLDPSVTLERLQDFRVWFKEEMPGMRLKDAEKFGEYYAAFMSNPNKHKRPELD